MSAPVLWTAQEAARAVGGRTVGSWQASGVSIDSRTLAPGDLFFAIEGDSDGHDYVVSALNNGAAAAVVARVAPEMESAGPLLVVDDTLDALAGLGGAARARSEARVAGITGSVGKTGTKEALRHVLGQQDATHASEASYNNLWGVPLSLARMPKSTVYGIFEIGMNHAGEIRPLSKLVRPQVALITTVEPVHMEFFKCVEDIAEAKAEIFEGLEPDGVAIINRDSPFFERLATAATTCGAGTVLGFGAHVESDARLVDLSPDDRGSTVAADICGKQVSYRLNAPGRHLAANSLAVLAAVHALGGDVMRAAADLNSLQQTKGRGVRSEVAGPNGTFELVDESYNANPASMRAAIDALSNVKLVAGGRRIVVLGDMLELGDEAPRFHAELSDVIDAANIDLVFLCGPQMQHLWEILPASRRGAYAPDSGSLIASVEAVLKKGDVVMVKGSLGSAMGRVVDAFIGLGEEAATQTEDSKRGGE